MRSMRSVEEERLRLKDNAGKHKAKIPYLSKNNIGKPASSRMDPGLVRSRDRQVEVMDLANQSTLHWIHDSLAPAQLHVAPENKMAARILNLEPATEGRGAGGWFPMLRNTWIQNKGQNHR